MQIGCCRGHWGRNSMWVQMGRRVSQNCSELLHDVSLIHNIPGNQQPALPELCQHFRSTGQEVFTKRVQKAVLSQFILESDRMGEKPRVSWGAGRWGRWVAGTAIQRHIYWKASLDKMARKMRTGLLAWVSKNHPANLDLNILFHQLYIRATFVESYDMIYTFLSWVREVLKEGFKWYIPVILVLRRLR